MSRYYSYPGGKNKESINALVNKNRWVAECEIEYQSSVKITKIEIRKDLLFPFYTSVISQDRANRECAPKNNPVQQKSKKEECFFEPGNIHTTPAPRYYYPELAVDDFIPVSVPNLFPYGLEHKVNCFTSHQKYDPASLNHQDFYNYLLMSKENAKRIKNNGHARMFSMINFGAIAGGTQQHPHSQDGTIFPQILSTADREIEYCENLSAIKSDPFDYYMNLARDSPLFGMENQGAFVMAPFAPIFPDQLDIFLKPKTRNFLELEAQTMAEVGFALATSINFLSTKRGVTDFNIVAHQSALYSSSPAPYRLHFHIYPRNKNNPGGIETGMGYNIIDIYPESTGKALQEFVSQRTSYKF